MILEGEVVVNTNTYKYKIEVNAIDRKNMYLLLGFT